MRIRPTLILCLLVAGAVLNLAVAWLFAAWVQIGGSRQSTVTTIGSVHEVTVTDARLGCARINHARFSELTVDSAGSIQLARWSGDGSECSQIQAGWPFQSFVCTNYGDIQIQLGSSQIGMNKSGLNPIRGGIELAPQTGTGLWRALPYQPLWPGFVASTLFWSLISIVLYATISASMKHWRIRRGLCAACGYNVSGADHEVCPECGAKIMRNDVKSEAFA